MEPTLKVNEVAAILRLNPMTIYRWVKSGRLQATRIGKTALRIQKSEIYALLKYAPAYRAQCAREAEAFMSAHPNYYPTVENEKHMLDFIDHNNLPITSGSMTTAFDVLTHVGALELRPIPPVTEEAPRA